MNEDVLEKCLKAAHASIEICQMVEKNIEYNNLLNHAIAYLLNKFCQGKISLTMDELKIMSQRGQGLEIFKAENSDVYEISVLHKNKTH